MASNLILRGPKLNDPLNLLKKSVGEIILECLQKRDDKIALVDEETGAFLTYKQILEKSIQVANSLKKQKLKSDDVVGIICENRMEYCIPVFACFLLGIPTFLINPAYTKYELENCFRIGKPKLVFVSTSCVQTLLCATSVCEFEIVLIGGTYNGIKTMDAFMENSSKDLEFEFEHIDTKEHPLMILCSSGTTGLPKGVLITQLNLIVALTHLGDKNYTNLNENTISLAYLPFFHIFGFLVCVSGILFGGRYIVLKSFKPDIFINAIEKHKVNQLFAVPPVVLFLTKTSLTDGKDLSSIKEIFCGGSPLSEDLIQAATKKFNCEVRMAYGLTEFTGIVALIPFGQKRPGSTGKLIPNVECRVLDVENGKILGPGQMGELCLRTPSAMKCYFGNEKATKEIFDDDGFLHTGDVGFYDEDGFIFVVDRIKELIKYKGFQVPPAELESILLTHPDVIEAAVVPKPDERAGELPMAFVVKNPKAEIGEEDLVDLIAEHLSIQKRLYGGVQFVEQLPKNATGKIDRKKLKQTAKELITSQ